MYVQVAVEGLRGGRLHEFSGQPVPVRLSQQTCCSERCNSSVSILTNSRNITFFTQPGNRPTQNQKLQETGTSSDRKAKPGMKHRTQKKNHHLPLANGRPTAARSPQVVPRGIELGHPISVGRKKHSEQTHFQKHEPSEQGNYLLWFSSLNINPFIPKIK